MVTDLSRIITLLIGSMYNERNEEILFVCEGDAYHNRPMAMSDVEADPRVRLSHKLPLEQAIMRAQANLAHHRSAINDVVAPIHKRQHLSQQIQQQHDALLKEKERLIKLVSDRVDHEIEQLYEKNSHIIQPETQKASQNLKRELQEIDMLMRELKRSPRALQKALNYTLDQFGEDFEELAETDNGVFELYSDVRHDIEVSHLKFIPHATVRKPLRKVMNESPLYFLIDKGRTSSDTLGLFQPKERSLKTYNVATQNWNRYHCDAQLPQDGCFLQQSKPNRMFWIGGSLNGHPSDQIYIFDLSRAQERTLKLRHRRVSCMATLVAPAATPNKPAGILITGGTDEKKQIIKNSEFLWLSEVDCAFENEGYETSTEVMAETNFACLGGALFTYNGSSVVRLGGLGRGPGGGYSVVEVVERLQLGEWLDKGGKPPRWRYVELQVPQRDQIHAPRLFQAHQAAVQINPQEIMVMGGHAGGWRGVTDTYLISVQEVVVQGRVGSLPPGKQQRLIVRWPGEKPLISGGHFSGVAPVLWQGRLYSLQGSGEKGGWKLIEFDMYNWWQTPNAVPQ